MSAGNRGGGRLSKPTKVHIVDGTYRPDRHGKRSEPEFDGKLAAPPSHLNAIGKRKYREIGKMLVKAGVVTEADAGILALYAQSWSNWVAASLQVNKEVALQARIEEQWDTSEHADFEILEKRLRRIERQAIYASSAYTKTKDERLMIEKFGARLGLSPSDRARVKVEKPEKPKDEMEGLLSGSSSS